MKEKMKEGRNETRKEGGRKVKDVYRYVRGEVPGKECAYQQSKAH